MTTDATPLPQAEQTQRFQWGIVIGLCLFSGLLGRLCYLARPFDNDAAIFIYMGKMVTQGGRLCHDLIDNKFPTVGLMTSIAYRTFGTTWFAYIALQTFLSFTAAVLLGRMAGRYAGAAAVWPTALFTLVYMNFTTAVFGGFQLETLQAFFAVLAARSALMAIIDNSLADAFCAGLCAGTGAMFKPTGLAVLAAMGVALWVRYRWGSLKHLAVAAAGVAIPIGVAVIYIVKADLARDMPALYGQISTYASQSVWALGDLAKPFVVGVFLGFPMLVRGWVFRRQRDADSGWPVWPVMVFVAIWFIAEAAGIVMQRRMYAYHFLPLVPPAALLFGFFPRQCRPLPLMAAILPMAFLSITAAADVISLTYTGEKRLQHSDYLLAHTKPGDAIWIDSWPRVLLETDLQPGSRYPFTFLFVNYDNAGLDYAKDMIADFEQRKPAYIFLPTPMELRIRNQQEFIADLMRNRVRSANYAAGWHMIQDYTLAHYDRVGQVVGDAVYRRRPDASPQTARAE